MFPSHMRISLHPTITALVMLLAPMATIAQGEGNEVVMVKRSVLGEETSAEIIRFKEMLAKYKPLPNDELRISKIENVDNSALFEVRIEIPELGQVQITAVLFAAQHHEVDPIYFDWMDHYAKTLKRYPLAHVRIEAHTDSIGSESGNQVLSELRALEVKSQLVQRGIAESRIQAIGLGERHPVAPNEDAEGRRKNRRVDLLNYFPVQRH